MPPGLDGYNLLIGLEILEATPERVTGRLLVDDRHLQPYGVVHGGVYAGVAETVASVGAALAARERDPENGVVGLENHTSFVRSARAGAELLAAATPLHTGRRTSVWEVVITDAARGRIVARSTVRLLVTAPGAI